MRDKDELTTQATGLSPTLRAQGQPDDIVGHKTFDTGEVDPQTGFPKLRHEPLTRAEAGALLAACDAAKKRRAELMPDEKAAINLFFDAWLRLKDFGWSEAIYCPKDGSPFQVIEAGSTGVHRCRYEGEWPKGSWWVEDGDIWPSRPTLFRLYPEDQAKYDAKIAAAREAFRNDSARSADTSVDRRVSSTQEECIDGSAPVASPIAFGDEGGGA